MRLGVQGRCVRKQHCPPPPSATPAASSVRWIWAHRSSRRCIRLAATAAADVGSARRSDVRAAEPGAVPPWLRSEPVVAQPPKRTSLLSIRIQDFALVEQQELAFGHGLNAITGESGSGKSVLVEALALLLGAASPPECVRAPADMAVIQGSFWLAAGGAAALRQPLMEQGVPGRALPPTDAGSRMDVRREILIASPGTGNTPPRLRSRCFINGCPVTLRALRALSGLLVDMNGQHSSLALADPGTQVALLDRVAGCGGLVAEVSSTLQAMQAVEAQLEELDTLSDDYERALMRKMVDSVRKARIKPGEETQLKASMREMEAQRASAEQCQAARQIVAGDGSVGVGGGLMGGMRMLELQLKGMLTREANVAHAAELMSSGTSSTNNNSSSKGARSSRSSPAPTSGTATRAASPNLRKQQQEGAALAGSESVEREKEGGGEIDAVAEEQEEARARQNAVAVKQESAAAVAGGGVGEASSTPLASGTATAEPPQASSSAPSSSAAAAHAEVGGAEEAGEIEEAEEGKVGNEEEGEEEEEEHPIKEASLMLAEVRSQIVAIDDLVRTYSRSIAFSAAEFESTSERLRQIERLMRTHRCRTSAELLEAAQRAEEKLDAYEEMQANAEVWEQQLDQLRERLIRACCTLSAARRAAAPGLVQLVQGALSELAMGDARFDVQVAWTLEPEPTRARESEALDISAIDAACAGETRGAGTYRVSPRGLDSVVLRLAAGPSEPLRPLASVASGGEAARIMLALKAAPTGSSSGSSSSSSSSVNGSRSSANGSSSSNAVPGSGSAMNGSGASGGAGEASGGIGGEQGASTSGDENGGDCGCGNGQQHHSQHWQHTDPSSSSSSSSSGTVANGGELRPPDMQRPVRTSVPGHDTWQQPVQPQSQATQSQAHWEAPPSHGQADGEHSSESQHVGAHSPADSSQQQGLSLSYLDMQLHQADIEHSMQQQEQQQQQEVQDQVHGDPVQQQQQQQQQQVHDAPVHQQLSHQQQPQQATQLQPLQQTQQTQQQHTPILVLDELDSGVGSRLGGSVGAMLRRMVAGSNSGQVVCVTHLPQVACYADHHIKVLKHLQAPSDPQEQPQEQSSSDSSSSKRGRVTTRFAVLTSYEQRVQEVAEMMGMNERVAEDMLQRAWGVQQ